MAWLHKEIIDIRDVSDDYLEKKIRTEVMENMYNTPFIIKAGTHNENPNKRSQVTGILDTLHIAECVYRDDEIEVIRI